MLARKVNGVHNVCDAEAARDQRGAAVDHGVPDGARIVVSSFIGQDQLTAQAFFEFPDDVFL